MGETGNPSKGFVLIMQDCIDTICERKMLLCNTSSWHSTLKVNQIWVSSLTSLCNYEHYIEDRYNIVGG